MKRPPGRSIIRIDAAVVRATSRQAREQPASAALHIARTVARRAERLMVELAQKPGEHVNPEGLKYINRVSDFLFVAARAVNDNGKADVLWVPGKNR